jgi:hypothetical protein
MTRLLSGVALIAVAIAIVWSNQRLVFEMAAFVLLFAASYELISLFRAGGITVSRWPAMIASLLTLATFSGILGANISVPTTDAVLLVALIGLALVAMRAWRGGADGLTTISASLFPSLYVALPIGAMMAIREQGPAPLFLVMLTVIVPASPGGRLAFERSNWRGLCKMNQLVTEYVQQKFALVLGIVHEPLHVVLRATSHAQAAVVLSSNGGQSFVQ